MAAFTASFLNADPFLASAGQSVGNSTDALGNIFNAAGQHIGVVPGSQADLGSAGSPVTPSGSAAAPSTPTGSSSGSSASFSADPAAYVWNNIFKAGILGSIGTTEGAVENIVFIVIGLLLIGGALLAFSFKGATTIIDSASGTAGKVSRAAAKASALKTTVMEAAA